MQRAGLFLATVTIVWGGRPTLDSGVSFWTYPVWYDNRGAKAVPASRPQNVDAVRPNVDAARPNVNGGTSYDSHRTQYSQDSRRGGTPDWRHPRPSHNWPARTHPAPHMTTFPYSLHPTKPYAYHPPESRLSNRPHLRPPRSADDDRDVENYKSDLETPKDVPTRPDYRGKGAWAKGQLPNGKVVDVGFVPQKVYTQVRRYDTVRHLPRSAAVAEASTHEELINAPRLREVLSRKKIQQVYEEEGYEDSGYDHGGYNHHGLEYEDKQKNEDLSEKKLRSDNEPWSSKHKAVTSNSSEKQQSEPVGVRWKRFHTETQTKQMSWDDDDATKSVAEEISHVTEPFMRDSESATERYGENNSKSEPNGSFERSAESTTVNGIERIVSEGVENKEKVKSENENASQTAESRESSADIDLIEPAESHSSHSAILGDPSGRSVEARVVNDPRPKGSGVVTFPGRHTRRQYAMGRPVDVYVQESVGYGVRRPVYGLPVTTNVHHYVPYMPPFPSYYSDNPGAYTDPVISQRLPVVPEVPAVAPVPASPSPPPTLPPTSTAIPSSEAGPVKFLNAADTLNAYANLLQQSVSTNPPTMAAQNYEDLIEPRFNSSWDAHLSGSSPSENVRNSTTRRRRPSRFRHPVSNNRGKQYNNFTRGSTRYPDSGPSGKDNLELKNPSPYTRHPTLPRDSSEDVSDLPGASAQAAALTSKRHLSHHIRPLDPVKYIESLTVAHYANAANVPSSPPSVQNERLRELARQLNSRSEDFSGMKSFHVTRKAKRSAEIEYDREKYPFYDSLLGLPKGSALRYASNPEDLPKKTPGGMEFYEMKDKLVRCREPQPPEDIIPERSEDGEWNRKPQPENLPRIKGIGDSIDCLKRRYFGEDPFDNPFFKEDDIGEPTYELDRPIQDHINHNRKARSANDNKRLMIIPPRPDNSSYIIYNNYSDADVLMNQRRGNGQSTFPYKNHKPENAQVSASVHNLRASSPYKYYSEYDDSYLPTYKPQEGAHDSESDDSKRHKYYHHGHRYKYVSKKKKRVKPKVTHHFYRPLPVSIYSIIGATNKQPAYRKPVIYSAGSSQVSRVIPIYHMDVTRPSSSLVGDSQNSPTTPTRWYIVRPGEYTENKEIATDSKPSSSNSIWSYINPLRWWFPSYFDDRRGEPKYRIRRSSEQELFNRILEKTNNAIVESRVFESHRTTPRIETTTGQPISIIEFKARLNANNNRSVKTMSKLNRLTGGFISGNTYATPAPPLLNTINTPSHIGNGQVLTGTTPIPMIQGSDVSYPTTVKPKVLFPKTKTPRRRPQSTKKTSNSVSKGVMTTTTTTTTTSTTPITTTRMYKPKRVISKKKFDSRTPVDAFTVLKRAKLKATTPSPFDSVETSVVESGSIEEPRRMQQVEHRRVTKEEVYKTSFIPEEEARLNRNADSSSESTYYSVSSSEAVPMETTTEPDNHTLTYMVNPVTGVGSWGEKPRRTTWKPRRRFPKRHLKDDLGYKSTYSYPSGGFRDAMEQESSMTRRSKKRHSSDSPYNNEAYITGLMNQVHPTMKGQTSDFASVDSVESDVGRHFSSPSDETKSYEETTGPGSDESVTLPPTKSPPKFIMDPGKRKYFYVKTR